MGNLSHVAMLNILYNKICVHEMVHKQYRELRGHRYHGSYWPISGQPILTINDLDLVQHVLSKVAKSFTFVTSCKTYPSFHAVRDFDHFTDRNFVGLLWDKGTSDNDWIWRSNLFTLKGGHNWRLVRQTLNPIFTLSKMKVMYEASIMKFTTLKS